MSTYVKFVLIYFFSQMIFYTTPSLAKKAQGQSIDKIIDSTYTLHMKKVFLEISNRSNKSKNLYDFLSKLMPIEQFKSVENLKAELNKLKSPRVTVKNNSLKINFDGKTSVFMLGKNFGTLTFDGKEFSKKELLDLKDEIEKSGEKKTVRSISPIIDYILPTANAAVVVPIIWSILTGSVGTVVVSHAGLGALMAPLGCVSSLHDAKDSNLSYGERCKNGAIDILEFIKENLADPMTPIMATVGAISGARVAYDNLNITNPKAASKYLRILKGGGILGALALLSHPVEYLSTMNGTKLSCDDEPGTFTVYSLNNGGEKILYSSNNSYQIEFPHISYGQNSIIEADSGGIKNYIQSYAPKNEKLSDSQLDFLANQVIDEKYQFESFCQKNPGSSKRFMFTDIKDLHTRTQEATQ